MSKPSLPQRSAPEMARIFNFKSPVFWGVTDPARFQLLLDEATRLVTPGFFLGDNLFAWMRNNSALEDSAFIDAWRANILYPADEAVVWRRYILCCAAYHCVQLEGDFVECGALHGTGVKTVIDYFGKDRFAKTFWAYDTFDVHPVDGHGFEGQHSGLFDEVQTRFAGYPNVRLMRGLLPASLNDGAPTRIAYLHIDLNSAEFEIAVLDALFERVVPAGIVVLDDYEWSGAYRAQKLAEDVWFDARRYRVIPLPTGQGLVLKR